MGLTTVSFGMRSGPLWFLQILLAPKKVSGDHGPECGLCGLFYPSLCMGPGPLGEADALTSDQYGGIASTSRLARSTIAFAAGIA